MSQRCRVDQSTRQRHGRARTGAAHAHPHTHTAGRWRRLHRVRGGEARVPAHAVFAMLGRGGAKRVWYEYQELRRRKKGVAGRQRTDAVRRVRAGGGRRPPVWRTRPVPAPSRVESSAGGGSQHGRACATRPAELLRWLPACRHAWGALRAARRPPGEAPAAHWQSRRRRPRWPSPPSSPPCSQPCRRPSWPWAPGTAAPARRRWCGSSPCRPARPRP